jgi:hypothetical protein
MHILMNYSYLQSKIMTKKFALIALVVIVLLVILLFVSKIGRIEIVPPTGVEYSYVITDEKGVEVQAKTKLSGSMTSFIDKGRYSITITSSEGSYFQAVDQKGFLNKSKIAPTYTQENNREVYGYNPLDCSTIVENTLYSYVCGGYVYELEKHHPATLEQPSFSEPYTVPFGSLAGVFSSSDGTVVLSAVSFDDGYSTYSLGKVDENFNIVDENPQSNLNSQYLYKLSPYKEGFLIYDIQGRDAWYYGSVTDTPVAIPQFKEATSQFSTESQFYTRTTPYGIVTWQSLTKSGDEADLDNNEPSETKVVVFGSDSSYKEYSLSIIPSEIYVCGVDMMCITSGNTVSIYSTKTNKLKLLQIIGDVQDTVMVQKELAIISSTSVVMYDAMANSGYVSMNYGRKFIPCGISDGFNSYTICLTNPNLGSIALKTTLGTKESGKIEQKMIQLADTPELESFSVYKNIIYINTNNGETVYNPATNAYEYSTETVTKADAAVRKRAEDIGLTAPNYILINPFTSPSL